MRSSRHRCPGGRSVAESGGDGCVLVARQGCWCCCAGRAGVGQVSSLAAMWPRVSSSAVLLHAPIARVGSATGCTETALGVDGKTPDRRTPSSRPSRTSMRSSNRVPSFSGLGTSAFRRPPRRHCWALPVSTIVSRGTVSAGTRRDGRRPCRRCLGEASRRGCRQRSARKVRVLLSGGVGVEELDARLERRSRQAGNPRESLVCAFRRSTECRPPELLRAPRPDRSSDSHDPVEGSTAVPTECRDGDNPGARRRDRNKGAVLPASITRLHRSVIPEGPGARPRSSTTALRGPLPASAARLQYSLCVENSSCGRRCQRAAGLRGRVLPVVAYAVARSSPVTRVWTWRRATRRARPLPLPRIGCDALAGPSRPRARWHRSAPDRAPLRLADGQEATPPSSSRRRAG